MVRSRITLKFTMLQETSHSLSQIMYMKITLHCTRHNVRVQQNVQFINHVYDKGPWNIANLSMVCRQVASATGNLYKCRLSGQTC